MGNAISPFYEVFGNAELNEMIARERRTKLFLIYFYFLLSFILAPNYIAILTLGIYICVWRVYKTVFVRIFEE